MCGIFFLPWHRHSGARNLCVCVHSRHFFSFLEDGHSHLCTSSISYKLKPFSTFKTNFALENYIITNALHVYKRLNFTKRCVNAHKLHSETGRHTKPKTPSHLRFCPYCPNEVENELHFLLKCNKYNTDRTDLFSKLNFINFSKLSDEVKLKI
jgi:hypothetical protein